MAGNLSFAIAINLLTENFKRGTNQVKAAFRSMQMQLLTFAAALGAGGLGLSNLVSRLIDVARETNRVTTALKNVSGSTSQYADNQRYLLDLAKKYGLEINALTGNYAKFTAAASISGMSMENQRKIFESMSRACTAFGMSADDSNGVFLALSQMMSKGKISSEELRLQMGERLPIALQAMAKAAGTTAGGLDKLMKQGKLMSADVLPKFAEALNEMIPNVDTDNLETSVNRLKNAFTEFANSLNIQTKYKSLVDGLTEAISGLKGKLAGIVAFIITLISGKLLASIVNYFAQFWKLSDVAIRKAETAEVQKLAAVQKRIEAEKIYEATLTDYNTKENGKRLASKGQLAKAEKLLDATKYSEKKAMLAAATAAENAAAVSSTSVWGKALSTLKLGFLQLGRTMKAVFASAWPMLLITAIGGIIAKIVSVRKEAERVRNIFSDYQKNLWSAGNTAEITRMQTLVKVMNDRKKSQNEINAAQSELQRMIGKENLSQEEINKQVRTRISLLKEAAMSEAAFTTVGEYTEKNAKLGVDAGLSPEQMDRLAKLYPIKDSSKQNSAYYYTAMGRMFRENGVKGTYEAGNTDKAVEEFIQNLRVINDATSRAGKYQEGANKINVTPVKDPDNDKKEKRTPLQKEQDSYDKQFEELGAELEIGKITQAEYNKALGELNIKMYAQAKGTGDKKVLESEYFKIRKEAAEKAVRDQDKNTALVEFEKVQKDYNDKVKENQAQYDKGLISQKELNENIISLSLDAAKSAAGIKGIGDAADDFIQNMQSEALSHVEPVKIKPRDTTFDYKKTKVDIASEDLDKAKELADKYKEQAKSIGKTLEDEVANAMANVPDLEKALKLAQVKEDIKDFTKELNQMEWDGIKGAISNIDGMVSAFQRLEDAFDPESEATAWERLMAIWNTLTSVVDGMMSIIKTIEGITELTNKLTKAKESEAAMDIATTATKVTNASIGAGADIAASEVKKETAMTNIAANTAEGASESGKSAAKLPFPANIIAIGGAIAAAIALFAMIPKFATGGIVGGNSPSGDKILARLNSGEMILNKGQQSRLGEAIDSARNIYSTHVVVGGSVAVRGDKMELAINNSRRKQGKKPIS